MFQRIGVRIRAFFRDRSGVASIEFAIVAWPFFGVVLMIVNTFMVHYFRTSLDSAVQNLAADLRSGGSIILKDFAVTKSGVVLISADAVKARLQANLPAGMDASKIVIEVFTRANCRTNGDCWIEAYADMAKGLRKIPTFDANAARSNLGISGSSAGSQAVEFGKAGDSQYLVVYYPMPAFSMMFAKKDAVILPPTSVTGSSTTVFGLVSTAMWINDPSVGIF